MPGPKSRAVRGALDALTDVFDPKTYYHASAEPSITKFDPNALDSWEDFNPGRRGATFFTSDPKYANRILKDKYAEEKINAWEANESSLKYEEYLDELFERGESPTVYPVRIKTDEIFDYKNKKQVEDIVETVRDAEWYHKWPSESTWEDTLDLIPKGDWRMFENPDFQKLLKEKGYRGYKTGEPGTVGLFYPHEGDVRSIFAKFDPKKSKSGDILASGLLGAGALNELVNE
jgi:hypothetical protein